MTADQLKLRAYCHSLRHFQLIFGSAPNFYVQKAVVLLFEEELHRIEPDFKGLLPPVDTRLTAYVAGRCARGADLETAR